MRPARVPNHTRIRMLHERVLKRGKQPVVQDWVGVLYNDR